MSASRVEIAEFGRHVVTDDAVRSPADPFPTLAMRLDRVAADLRSLWAGALARGSFDEVARLVEASHAVHRALVALRSERVVPARPGDIDDLR